MLCSNSALLPKAEAYSASPSPEICQTILQSLRTFLMAAAPDFFCSVTAQPNPPSKETYQSAVPLLARGIAFAGSDIG
jgi:hypothetical protein